MEQLPESTMREASLYALEQPKRILPRGAWLVGILGLSIFGLGIVLIASVGNLPRPPAVQLAGSAIVPLANSVAPNMAIPGFQRRGNTLVGEVVTQDGTNLRLVFDARTKTLIGMRMVPQGVSSSNQR